MLWTPASSPLAKCSCNIATNLNKTSDPQRNMGLLLYSTSFLAFSV